MKEEQMKECSKIFNLIDEKEAIFLLRSLIQKKSVTHLENEKAVSDFIVDYLKHSNVKIEIDQVSEKRENLLISLQSDPCQPSKRLIFSGHFDTVPPGNVNWTYPIYEGKIEGKKLYGRGSTDMKSGIAAMILAMKYIKASKLQLKGDLCFVGTVGEEVDCIGAKKAIEKGYMDQATAIVVGEPTTNKIRIAHKGVLWLKISIFGKTAHGSMPSLGLNAIDGMVDFINELRDYTIAYDQHPILGESTMNVGTINGGVSTNVVPDQCTIEIDIRTVPGQKHANIKKDILRLLEKVTKQNHMTYELVTINNLSCVSTPLDHEFIKLANETNRFLFNTDEYPGGVNYYTDASIFSQSLPDVPVLIYGPGKPELAHQPDEYVEIDNFIASIRFYIQLAVQYLT
ncbi:MAG: M20 family metallopeptidase [Bacillota bacterium]